MLREITEPLGMQGKRLVAKIILGLVALVLLGWIPSVIAEILNKSYGLEWFTGIRVLGGLVALLVVMIHKNII